MAAYPGALASFLGFTAGNTLKVDVHASQHNLEQAEIVAVQTKVGTGASTPTNQKLLRGNGTGTSAWSQADLSTDVTGQLPAANALNVLRAVYPVGCIYTSTSGVNPGTTFGFGTWVAFGAGQVLVGNGTSDQAFVAGATGGESNHTLTSNEMPSHTHTQDAHTHSGNVGTGATGSYAVTGGTVGPTGNTGVGNTIATNQNTGGGASHNNLQPYIVVYFWQRTA